ncbi:MAG: peptidylprolyl isomerase [Chthoniobacterales bacterium]
MKSDLCRFGGLLALATAFSFTAVAQDDKPAAPAEDTSLPDPVAIVEGEKISRSNLQEAFSEAIGASGISPDDLTPDQKMAGYREILDQLIIDKLVSRKASSVDIPDAEVDAEVTRVKSQFPSEEVFKAEMTKAGETDTSFRDTVKKMMQQQKWMENQIGDQTKVADDEVKKFYDENKKEFEHPELVRASHILILVPEDASDEVVAEKKKAADAALARVTEKKEDFATVAKEVSEEPGAKESSGDLDFFPKDRMVPEFADAAFAMKKGDISKEPVRTKFGWHVINVTDRKDSGSMPYDEVKEQVGSYLEGSKRRDVVRGVIESVRSEAKVDNKLPAAPAAPAPTAPAGS